MMAEYTPLELSPALEWLVAQAASNPKAIEDDHAAAELRAVIPDQVPDGGVDQIALFSDIFDNPRMRAVMREFWTIYREEKAAGNIRSANPTDNPWA